MDEMQKVLGSWQLDVNAIRGGILSHPWQLQ